MDSFKIIKEALSYTDGLCACAFCGWQGKWSEADTVEEGDFESGYYTIHVCPNGCEEKHADVSLYEVPDNPTS